jgi:hypothetical protein
MSGGDPAGERGGVLLKPVRRRRTTRWEDAGIGNVDLEDDPSVSRAIDLFANGLDFTDSLHLASSGARHFVSFNSRLLSQARRLGFGNVSTQ